MSQPSSKRSHLLFSTRSPPIHPKSWRDLFNLSQISQTRKLQHRIIIQSWSKMKLDKTITCHWSRTTSTQTIRVRPVNRIKMTARVRLIRSERRDSWSMGFLWVWTTCQMTTNQFTSKTSSSACMSQKRPQIHRPVCEAETRSRAPSVNWECWIAKVERHTRARTQMTRAWGFLLRTWIYKHKRVQNRPIWRIKVQRMAQSLTYSFQANSCRSDHKGTILLIWRVLKNTKVGSKRKRCWPTK